MTVASYERDPAETGECLFPVVPKIIASTTQATTTPTRPETPPTPQNTRSRNDLQKPLDVPTSFISIEADRTEPAHNAYSITRPSTGSSRHTARPKSHTA